MHRERESAGRRCFLFCTSNRVGELNAFIKKKRWRCREPNAQICSNVCSVLGGALYRQWGYRDIWMCARVDTVYESRCLFVSYGTCCEPQLTEEGVFRCQRDHRGGCCGGCMCAGASSLVVYPRVVVVLLWHVGYVQCEARPRVGRACLLDVCLSPSPWACCFPCLPHAQHTHPHTSKRFTAWQARAWRTHTAGPEGMRVRTTHTHTHTRGRVALPVTW